MQAVANLMQQLSAKRDEAAALNPSDPASILRRIEQEASAKFPNDMAARFAYRNELRAGIGLEPEKRERGGVAGAYDRGDLVKIAAVLAAPVAFSALGGLAAGGAAAGGAGAAGTAAGTAAGAGAAGAAGAATAAGSIATPLSVGGLVAKGKDWLTTGSNALKLGSGIAGVMQQQQGNQMIGNAAKRDEARWAQGAPLRASGMAGMLAPVPADTSSLGAIAAQGNPFAPRPSAPVPQAMPQAPANAPLPPIPAKPPKPRVR